MKQEHDYSGALEALDTLTHEMALCHIYHAREQKLEAKIRAAITAAKGDGWLPVESAPKDGTTILLSDGKCVLKGRWGSFVDGQDDWQERECWGIHDCEDAWYSVLLDDNELTHWMPLPKPPQDGGDDGI